MTAPKGHPYGENIRCHPSETWTPQNRSDAVEDEFQRPPTWLAEQEAKAGPLYHALAHAPVTLTPNGSSGDGALEAAIAAQMLALFQLFKDRQRKYGPANIAAFGDHGVLVRCHDKLARLRRHYVEGTGDMPDESVDDAWRDLAVYAVIALVCREGGWPGWKGAEK